MKIPVHFPGGACVSARVGPHVVTTDQPAAAGGNGSAPGPFELFLTSIATCAGFYALRFCQNREIPTEGLGLDLETLPVGPGPITGVRLNLRLPPGFPPQYHDAIGRAIDQCAVKRVMQLPMSFEIETRAADAPNRRPAEIPSERSLELVGESTARDGDAQ